MTTHAITKQMTRHHIGTKPVVVIPLSIWQDIEEKLEEWEIAHTTKLSKQIAKARAEVRAGKIVSFDDLVV